MDLFSYPLTKTTNVTKDTDNKRISTAIQVADGRVCRKLLSAGSTASKASGVGAAKVPLAYPYDSQRRLKACHGRQQTWRECAPAAEINIPATTLPTRVMTDRRSTESTHESG